MCPDKELISAHFDGETSGKWISEINEHIKSCNECRVETSKIASMSRILDEVSVPDEEAIKKRVYAAVERRKTVIYSESLWTKHFDVSFSVILSAAAVVVVLCAALLFGLQRFSLAPAVVEEIKEEPELTVQILSLEDVAGYLLSDDTGFDVLITIPSSGSLSVSGEPQLIREADYRRGQ